MGHYSYITYTYLAHTYSAYAYLYIEAGEEAVVFMEMGGGSRHCGGRVRVNGVGPRFLTEVYQWYMYGYLW